MHAAYLQIRCIYHNKVDASTGNLSEMAIQDASVASAIVTAIRTTPKVPGALGRKGSVPLLDFCDIRWLKACVAETMPDRVADGHGIR